MKVDSVTKSKLESGGVKTLYNDCYVYSPYETQNKSFSFIIFTSIPETFNQLPIKISTIK